MKILVALSLIFTSINLTLAQTETRDFGEVIPAEFRQDAYPDAPAVVIFFKERFNFEHRDYIYPQIEYHIRVLVKNAEGIEEWGNYHLGDENVKFSKIRAATYRLVDGKVVTTELDKDKVIVDRKGSFEKNFSLPNVKEGDIVELMFTALFYRNIRPSHVIQHDNTPVLWSEFMLGGTVPLTSMIVGALDPAIYDKSYKGIYSRWVFRNVPPFIKESWMTAPRNHYARIEFFLPHDNWTDVSKAFQKRYFLMYEKFQKRVLKKAADDAVAGMTNDVDKVKAIVEYVKRTFSWTGEYDYLAYNLSDVFEKKKGSSGDLNILLNIMLQEAGFKPTLVLLSTRSNGWIHKGAPSSMQFNHILSKLDVGDKTLFLDATDDFLAFDALPEECINTEGFEMVGATEMAGTTFNWVKVFPTQRDKINVNARLTLHDDHSLRGRVTVMSSGFAARDKRISHQKDGLDGFVKNNAEVGPWSIDSTKIINAGKLDLPFQEVYFATIPDRVTGTPERMYVDPFVMLVDRENIWKEESREFPIDLRVPVDKQIVVTLMIPSTYKVEELPPSQTFTMPDNSISCSFKVTQSNNIIVSTYQFVTRRTLFAKEEYTSIREFYTQILARQAKPIVVLNPGK